MRILKRLPVRWRSWQRTEDGRAWAATGGSVVVAAVILSIWLPGPFTPWQIGWVSTLLTWSLLTGFHALLTWLACRNLRGRQLATAFVRDVRKLRRSSRAATWFSSGYSGAISFAAQMAGLALIGVLGLLVFGELRRTPVLLILGAVLVVTSWLDVLMVYAVHYARLDHHPGNLSARVVFPDDDERAFSDYVYLATSLQTTFGPPDLVGAGRDLRRVMTAHALLAFVFNTVIIAVIVSLALTVNT
ncbi:DUF1345 domain-containing protein [Granulicoccus sp. GXG6511]|uniref:DUF1345 domain-containing protein n=1 Tax=Granulicoccus sp. GXG6511 TaxID=3381351 RepID=UPI003D7E7D9E